MQNFLSFVTSCTRNTLLDAAAATSKLASQGKLLQYCHATVSWHCTSGHLRFRHQVQAPGSGMVSSCAHGGCLM